MLNINWIIKNQEIFLKSMKKRGISDADDVLHDILTFNDTVKMMKQNIEAKLTLKKAISRDIAFAKSRNKDTSNLERQSIDIDNNIKEFQTKLEEHENVLKEILSNLPNILDDSVPEGESENDNKFIREWGQRPQFDFNPKEHWQMNVKKHELDFERAAKISGSRFSILRGNLARLERALINFMLDICTKEFGHEEILLPYLLNEKSAFASGHLPKFSEDLFKTNNEKYLIATSEMSMVNLYRDEILKQKELPIRLCSYSQCFRSEAGSGGRDTAGILRQHQFSKVELVSIVHPKESENEQERMLACAEKILQKLGLHYRVILLCSKDTGFCASKTYDIEVWLPGQNKYREICSCSNTKDFQSKRAMIRYKDLLTEKNENPHILNSSALPIGRTIIAILEQYQISNGDFIIPEVLSSYF